MAQAGYTPIQLYYSTTAAAVPTAGNLASGELAINITDGKLYYKNNSGTVTLLAGATSGPAGGSNTQVQFNSSGVLAGDADLTFDGTTLSTAGLTASGTVTLSGGTANGVAYLNGSKVVTSGSALTFDGQTLGVTSSAVTSADINSTNANGSVFSFKNSGTAVGWVGNGSSSFVGASASNFGINGQSNLLFGVSGFEQMRLTSTGLGIGTSTAYSKLYLKQPGNGSGVAGFVIENSANDNRLAQYFDGSGDEWRITASYGSTGAFKPITFWTSDTKRLTLDSSGNLGLGVTPSAWNGSRLALQIGGANGGYVTADNGLALGSNYAYVSGDKFVANGYAPLYFMSKSAGSHQWYISNNNASGAGATVSFTQAMTLDASGNLALGTTSVFSGTKFTANGAVQVGYVDASNAAMQFSWNGPSSYGKIQTFSSSSLALNPDGNNVLVGTTSSSTGIDTGNTRMFVVAPDSNFGAALTTVGDNQGRGVRFTDQSKTVTGAMDAGNSKITFGSNSSHPLTFITAGTEKARIESSGAFYVGTTGSGSLSNYAPVYGGSFKTAQGSVSTTSGVAATLFTAPGGFGSYFITVWINADDCINYQLVAVLSTQPNGSAKINTIVSANLMTVSLSGYNVQATQNSGGSATVNYTATRIAG